MICCSTKWQKFTIAYGISLIIFAQMVLLVSLSSQVHNLEEESVYLERRLHSRAKFRGLTRDKAGEDKDVSEEVEESVHNSDEHDDGDDDDNIDEPQVRDVPIKRSTKIAEDLLERAHQRNVNKSTLPTDSDIIDLYNIKHPVVYGKETCAAYRKNVPAEKRILAPAGLFNTGTNLVYELLKKNCKQDPGQFRGESSKFVEDGVAWGKHIPPWWRDVWRMTPTRGNAKTRQGLKQENPVVLPDKPKILERFESSRRRLKETITRKNIRAKPKERIQYPNVDKNFVMPVVTVKDPYTWMQSMCRHPYSLVWMHDPEHCPNLLPNDVDVKRNFVPSTSDLPNGIPVQVNYRQSSGFSYHQSMVHLWNEWNAGYLDSSLFTHPRLMVRFEDLVFNPEPVIREVCACVGGTMAHSKFQLMSKSAKGQGGSHEGSSGLLGALQRYGSKTKRVEKYEDKDLEFVQRTLDPKLMETFGYKDPSSYAL